MDVQQLLVFENWQLQKTADTVLTDTLDAAYPCKQRVWCSTWLLPRDGSLLFQNRRKDILNTALLTRITAHTLGV